MYDVLTVADAILKIAKAQGKSLTPMQLVKLTYIAHGWSLGLRGKDLFANRIEAWQYGPVIPDLYHATKSYGRDPIPLGAIGPTHEIAVSPEDQAFLSDVFNKYGHLDGIALSYLTHRAGTPWTQVYDSRFRGIEIPDELIAQHYRDLANGRPH
ncbi:type II toxin-antitoxin system antitoxin SocA domain-containing protein [Stenotrophomonas sp. 278]|uniref:Panacea domain-containing protein n=1 Tax=Stenotrophomonas sp. 278 TaxID=2479851 RepID=UPI000F68E7E3|nr:type II toxin-antitoxin system antitoxin SocA domain-containing protein [Stenotrophomonas sp. 278]RRT96759.1 DUF4065 domain-containing protein [Stenotrophomonas sp. 278]